MQLSVHRVMVVFGRVLHHALHGAAPGVWHIQLLNMTVRLIIIYVLSQGLVTIPQPQDMSVRWNPLVAYQEEPVKHLVVPVTDFEMN